jgi:protein-tyrosine phosphatase
MGAGFMRQRLIAAGLDQRHQVASAGVWAVDGQPASANAIATMAERGIDITDHIAHTLDAADVTGSDLILVMSREHEWMIQNTWPQYRWKVHRLSEMVGKRKDVRDPYGGPIEEYRTCADTLADYVDRGFQRILELVEGHL